MNIKHIYDAVRLSLPNCGQNEFLTALDQSVRTYIGAFKMPYVVMKGQTYGRPMSVNEDIPVYDEYFAALLNNVLFLISGDTNRKTDSTAEAENAYRAVWSIKSRGRRFVDRGYYYDV